MDIVEVLGKKTALIARERLRSENLEELTKFPSFSTESSVQSFKNVLDTKAQIKYNFSRYFTNRLEDWNFRSGNDWKISEKSLEFDWKIGD